MICTVVYNIHRMQLVIAVQLLAFSIEVLQQVFIFSFLQQGNCSIKSDKITQLTHINAITIGVADLRR